MTQKLIKILVFGIQKNFTIAPFFRYCPLFEILSNLSKKNKAKILKKGGNDEKGGNIGFEKVDFWVGAND